MELWVFVFPREMPSKCEVSLTKLRPREAFLLGLREPALGHSWGWEQSCGALTPFGWVLCSVLSGGWFGCMTTLWRAIIMGFFFPCASFSSTFFARSNSMIHIKNILIPGQHWLTMKKPTRDSQYTPRNKWITIYSHFESVSFSRSNPSVSS